MDATDLTKEYSNGEVTIVWKNSLCKHAAECVKNNPEVFHPKEKPWIIPENSTTDKIITTVNKCPSGALTYYLNKK
ncbi:(4Fe-4S)-binding protein [Flavobacterium sp. SUN046]|uniref:(4Fe-4S)-binding protein n=1 Tax=Flavobacterium sp. SUN046 TaxID=3002440 RepID=UPI002DB99CDC|nr:(4Fe-4S)-binding protein [Flavobacterium sp. SUN046]MEC4050371.1 (4Fe-4S)-binding protein [Flavobacterium sp. SUN046]